MRRSFFIMISIHLLFSACMKDSVTEQFTFYRPVYRTRDEVREGIKSDSPQAIEQPGKIVVKDHYLFLNEVDKGVHIIDIADPAKPNNIAFIAIPGCVDLAIKGTYLYADCYTDLVTIDISQPLNITVRQFLSGVFPHRYYQGFSADTSKVIKEWIRVDTIVNKRFSGTLTHLLNKDSRVFLSNTGIAGSQATGSFVSSAGVGIAGSLARFALLDSRMYTVSQNDLKVFNLTLPASPSFVSSVSLQQGNIETIFPYKNKLFIGSQSGMFIFDVSLSDNPQKYSQFTHARSCDPVIADDKYAYVTLSGGSACGGFSNQLDVIDISNLSSPVLVKSFNLTSPKGLSKDGNLLLVCDGKAGLKILDATNVPQIWFVKQVVGFEANDVIAMQGIAMVAAKDGLYLIDYSNPDNASVISKIQISQNK